MGSDVKEQEVCPNCGHVHTPGDANIGLEKLVKDIREKAKAEAEKLKAEARADSDHILLAAGKKAETIKLTADAEVTKQTSHIVRSGCIGRKPARQARAPQHPESAPRPGV